MFVQPARSLISWLRRHLTFLTYFSGWTIYFTYFWTHTLRLDEKGNMMAGNVNIWGDWAAHFTMGSAMAYRSLALYTSPFLINASFSYPFVTNFIPAVLIRVGVPFFTAFIIPSYLFSLVTIGVLYYFYKLVLKSNGLALVASFIFLLNGGLGFLYFFSDILASPTPWQTIISPPREYTNMESDFIRWISVINSQVVPQRAFTLGFPLAVLALIIALKFVFPASSKKMKKLGLAPVMWLVTLLGLLPIIHTHSFLAVFIILGGWGLSSLLLVGPNRKNMVRMAKSWLQLALLTSLIAIPLIKTFLATNIESGFLKWHPGWYTYKFPELNWVEFWLKNWGVTPIMALIGYYAVIAKAATTREKLVQFIFFLPFFILFASINLFLFQPFIWDNTKLLTWASVGMSALAAVGLQRLWSIRPLFKLEQLKNASRMGYYWLLARTAVSRTMVAGLFVLIIFSGAIDAWRMIRFDVHTYQMYSQEELSLAEWAKSTTSTDSIWLTGDQHNNWLYNLTGRQPLLTFRGWLWTHGYDYHTVEQDVITLFQHPERQDLFKKYGVDYAIISYNEKEVWQANEPEFRSLYPVIKETRDYVIFAIPQTE